MDEHHKENDEPLVPSNGTGSSPVGSEIADELEFAPLANLSGRAESEMAKTLVHHLAERYPRGTGKDDTAKGYRQVKTRAGFETAIAAFLELLAPYGDEWRGGWIRCSLDKDARKGREVTWRQFRNVREAWVAAQVVDTVKGYPGSLGFGNPGPSHGKMTVSKTSAAISGSTASAPSRSWAWPGVRMKSSGLPNASTSA